MTTVLNLILLPLRAPMVLLLLVVSTYLGLHWSRPGSWADAGMSGVTDLIWSATDGRVIRNAFEGSQPFLAESPQSRDLAKRLKGLGFKFCGPVITYAFMQAVGMVNDHRTSCPRWKVCDAAADLHNAQF